MREEESVVCDRGRESVYVREEGSVCVREEGSV